MIFVSSKMDIEDDIPDSIKVHNSKVLYDTHALLEYLITNNIIPDASWFIQEYKNLLKYTTIDWESIYNEYKWSDPYFCDIIYDIKKNLINIIEEYSCKDNFSLQQYFALLDNIIKSWEHYNEYYISKIDDELTDLFDGFKL